MEIKNHKKEKYGAVGWQSWRRKVEKCIWMAVPCHPNPVFIWIFCCLFQKRKKNVTNKVMVCDQKHKSNTLPLKMLLFGSSKASKPAAPYGQTQHSVALILYVPHSQSNDSLNHTQPNQINGIKKETFFVLPIKAPNHTQYLSAWAPNEEAASECSNGGTSWWVVVGGLIWGQSIDLLSLYLLPTHHAKINGKANSSPPQCGLVNTQLISQSLKLTSQLLTYWYGRHVLNTHTHAAAHSNTNICSRCKHTHSLEGV